MNDLDREWIMSATIEQLLHRWRMAPIGDAWFQDADRAELHHRRMSELRAQHPEGWTAASKRIGWG